MRSGIVTDYRQLQAERSRALIFRCVAGSHAYGTGAALCAARRCRPADLDVAALQQRLSQDGAVIRVPEEERAKLARTDAPATGGGA